MIKLRGAPRSRGRRLAPFFRLYASGVMADLGEGTSAARPPSKRKINGDFIAKKGKHNDDLEALLANRPKGFELPPERPEYYEEDGLRKIKPYTFAFHAYAKERWQNRKLVEVLARCLHLDFALADPRTGLVNSGLHRQPQQSRRA